MATHRTIAKLAVREEPDKESAKLGEIQAGQRVTAHGAVINKYINVEEEQGVQKGFVVERGLEKLPGPIDDELNDDERVTFAQIVTTASRVRGADRDYLLAVAFTESRGINNIKSASSSCFGPFQYLQATWDGLIEKHGAETGLTKDGWVDWTQQAAMGAVHFADDLKIISDALGKTPTLGEMYFLHWAGATAGIPILQGDRSRNYVDAHRAIQPDRAQAVLDANRSVVEGRSVDDVVAELGKRLDAGWTGVKPIIATLPPEYRFLFGEDNDPPWMRVAEQERHAGVAEFAGAMSNARIEEYHQIAAGVASTDDVPWCGSFVTYCLKTCGNAKAVDSVVAEPRRAASWKTWGTDAPEPTPRGAAIVLKPQAAGSSGHVGFFASEDETHVTLLGGNQSDAVSLSKYKKGEVVKRRMIDWT